MDYINRRLREEGEMKNGLKWADKLMGAVGGAWAQQ